MKKESGLFALGVVLGVVGACAAMKHKDEIKDKVNKLEKKIKDKKTQITEMSNDKIMQYLQKLAEKFYNDKNDKKEDVAE